MININKSMPQLDNSNDDKLTVIVAKKNLREGNKNEPVNIPTGFFDIDTTQTVIITRNKRNTANVKQTDTKRRIMASKPWIALREQVELNVIMREINKKTSPNQMEIVVIVAIIIVTISGKKIYTKI